MKSLEAICAEYIGEWASLYQDDVFEEQTFPVLHQLVKHLQADDLNRLEPILLRHGIDVDLAWKRLCSMRWNNMLGTMQPLSLDLFQQRIYPDFKTFYYSRQFLLNLSACVRNFKYGSVSHIPPNHLDVLALHTQQEQWILRNIAAGKFVTGESPSELQSDLLRTALFCTTITLQGSEIEYVNTNDELLELFVSHLKHLTIQTISIASFPHIKNFLQALILRGSLIQIALKNILVSEESLTELMSLICGINHVSHTYMGSDAELSVIDSYNKFDTKDSSMLSSTLCKQHGNAVSNCLHPDNNMSKSLLNDPENQPSTSPDSAQSSSMQSNMNSEQNETDEETESPSSSKVIKLQNCESDVTRTKISNEECEFDLFDEAIILQRQPISGSLSLMSSTSSSCICAQTSSAIFFQMADAKSCPMCTNQLECRCNKSTKSSSRPRILCDSKLEAFALNATHRLDVGHLLAQVLPGWTSLRKLALVSVMDVWSKAFECILELLKFRQLTHLVLDMADIGIDGFGRLFQVLAFSYSFGNSASTSRNCLPLQQLLVNMARPVETFPLSITGNLSAVISLDLGSNTFGPNSFAPVLHFISNDHALRILNFAYCGLTGSQVIDLLHVLIKRGSESLDELYLDDNNRDGVVDSITDAVSLLASSIKTLQVLSLSRCCLPGSLVKNSPFIPAVINHPSLNNLNLGNNRFGVSLLPFLEKILSSRTNLKKLNVGYNYLQGEDLKSFVDRLLEADPNRTPTLQELDISGNNVGILSASEWDALKYKFGRFACDINATYIGIHHHFDDFVAQM